MLYISTFVHQNILCYIQLLKLSFSEGWKEIHMKYTQNNLTLLGNHYGASTLIRDTEDAAKDKWCDISAETIVEHSSQIPKQAQCTFIELTRDENTTCTQNDVPLHLSLMKPSHSSAVDKSCSNTALIEPDAGIIHLLEENDDSKSVPETDIWTEQIYKDEVTYEDTWNCVSYSWGHRWQETLSSSYHKEEVDWCKKWQMPLHHKNMKPQDIWRKEKHREVSKILHLYKIVLKSQQALL